MRRLGFILICLIIGAVQMARGELYTLKGGASVSGDPVSPYKDDGVVFHQADDSFSDRITWDRFTQEAILKLKDAAKSASDREMVEPLIDAPPPPPPKHNDINVKPVEMPPRPAQTSAVLGIFYSPVGWFLILVLWGATIFAGYEVAMYRKHPRNLVCGLAAIPFFGVLSPVLFLAIPPTRRAQDTTIGPVSTDGLAHTPESAVPVGALRRRPGEAAPSTPEPLASVPPVPTLPGEAPAVVEPAVELPAPVTYSRSETSFNRRFFETKLTGFFRAVPSPAEKDLRIHIKSARGDYVGRRIIRITPAELYLQVGKGDITADEMIPFTEVMEVQIRHKDLA